MTPEARVFGHTRRFRSAVLCKSRTIAASNASVASLPLAFAAERRYRYLDDNTDGYEPEADTILPRLEVCRTAQDVRSVVHEESGVTRG
jgi:hypothetical protein